MAGVRTSVAGSGYGSVYVDSLIWGGTAWDQGSGSIKVYFGESAADLTAASRFHHGGGGGLEASALDGWSAAEKNAFQYAMDVFSSVCNVDFDVVTSADQADVVWWQTGLGDGVLGMHETPADGQVWGYFNPHYSSSWGNLRPGGDGLYTILHELGHGLGLAHPHDGGGEADATAFPGLPWWWPPTGDRGMSQGIWTVMSYNTGYDLASKSISMGGQTGLGAFDIAALQALYGANTSTRTGDDVYDLPVADVHGTGWSSIWDAGGNDTISAARANQSVVVDLRPATLATGAVGAGGFVSQVGVIGGGFTIANGVLIENAVGGSGNDRLIGNEAANVINGGGGADRMEGRGGDDTYYVNTIKDIIHDVSGTETVYASTTYALGSSARIEILSAVDVASRKPINLTGSSFSNTINGNAGSNVLNGKGGNDVLTGGAGRDSFVFDTKLNSRANVDQLPDFAVRDDTIRLENSVFRGIEKPGYLASSAFRVTTTSKLARDADDRIIYNEKTGYLYYDPDGIGGTGAVKFAQLDQGLKVKASDFYIV
jgi:serralysin